MKVLESQLAVAQGIVRERTQQLGSNSTIPQEVFATRRCRNSYGVVLRVPYEEKRHKMIRHSTDPVSGQKWVDDVVDWSIRQGEPISADDGVKRPYGASIADGMQHNPRHIRVVMSTLPVYQLPMLASQRGCHAVAAVNYRLRDNDLQKKGGSLLKFKKKYWKAEFSFVVKVGAADLRFQVHGANGLVSSDHDNLEVEFLDPSKAKPPKPQQNGQNGHASLLMMTPANGSPRSPQVGA